MTASYGNGHMIRRYRYTREEILYCCAFLYSLNLANPESQQNTKICLDQQPTVN